MRNNLNRRRMLFGLLAAPAILRISSVMGAARIDLTGFTKRYLDAVNGSDSNDGLTTSTAWKTRAYAWTMFRDNYNMRNQQVQIKLLSNFQNGCQILGPQTEQLFAADFEFYGDDSSWNAPGSFVIDANVDYLKLFDVNHGARFRLRGMTLRNAGIAGFGVAVSSGYVTVTNMFYGQHGATYGANTGGAALDVCSNMSVIECAGNQVWLNEQSRFAMVAEGTGNIFCPAAITISGAPAFTECFAQADLGGYIDFAGATVAPGSATGQRSRSIAPGIVHAPGVTLPGSWG